MAACHLFLLLPLLLLFVLARATVAPDASAAAPVPALTASADAPRALQATPPQCPMPGCPGVDLVNHVAATICTPADRNFCSSRKCAANTLTGLYECQVGTCSDGLQNDWETGIDCGGDCSTGSYTQGCLPNSACFNGEDCKDLVCLFSDAYDSIVRPSLAYEQWIDGSDAPNAQGGSCVANTCFDLVMNGLFETDADCGATACCTAYDAVSGAVPRLCPWLCRNGFRCLLDTDCSSGRCVPNQEVGQNPFCAAPLLSNVNPDLSSRAQGGTTIYGPVRVFFDPEPNWMAVAFILNLPFSQISQDATVDVQRAVEQGNLSYLDERLVKGWSPGLKSASTGDDDTYVPGRRLEDQDQADGGGSGDDALGGLPAHPRTLASLLASNTSTKDPRSVRRLSNLLFRSRVEIQAARLVRERVPPPPEGPDQALPRVLFRSGPTDERRPESVLTRFELEFEFGAGRRGRGPSEFESRLAQTYGEAALDDYRRYLLADLSGLAHPDEQPWGARALALAPQSRRLATGNPSYNMTHTDTAIGVQSRYLLNMESYEVELLISRSTVIFNMSLLAGGWPAELAMMQELDWLEQDLTYCMTYANYSIAAFNGTNADCAPFLFVAQNVTNCTNATTGLFQFNNATNCTNASAPQPVAAVAPVNPYIAELYGRRLWSPEGAAAALDAADAGLASRLRGGGTQLPQPASEAGRRLRRLVLDGGGKRPSWRPPSGARRLGANDGFEFNDDEEEMDTGPDPGVIYVSPLDVGYLQHPQVRQQLLDHAHMHCRLVDADAAFEERVGGGSLLRLYCPPRVSSLVADGHDLARLSANESQSGAAAAARVLRRKIMWAPDAAALAVEAAARSTGRRAQLTDNIRANMFSGTTFTYSQLVPGVLPGVPRVSYTQLLSFYGTNFDTTRGVHFLTNSNQESSSLTNGAPTANYLPATVRVLIDPRGTPNTPLYRSVSFPQQPAIILVDRHGRLLQGVNIIKNVPVTAFLDPALYPANGPTKLTGLTTLSFSTVGSGIVFFTDLAITTPLDAVVINFTASYTSATSQVIIITGATRVFSVFEPPPIIVIYEPRIPLSPFAVIFLTLFSILGIAACGVGYARGNIFLRTPLPRSDIPPEDLEGRARRQMKPYSDDNFNFSANRDLEDRDDDEEALSFEAAEAAAAAAEAKAAAEALARRVFVAPPPVYNESQLPGVGPSFQTAFGFIERQLQGIDDTPGAPEDVHGVIQRYQKSDEPEILAAKREAAMQELRAAEARADLERKRLTISLFGREIVRFDAAGRAVQRLKDMAGIGAAQQRALAAQRAFLDASTGGTGTSQFTQGVFAGGAQAFMTFDEQNEAQRVMLAASNPQPEERNSDEDDDDFEDDGKGGRRKKAVVVDPWTVREQTWQDQEAAVVGAAIASSSVAAASSSALSTRHKGGPKAAKAARAAAGAAAAAASTRYAPRTLVVAYGVSDEAARLPMPSTRPFTQQPERNDETAVAVPGAVTPERGGDDDDDSDGEGGGTVVVRSQ